MYIKSLMDLWVRVFFERVTAIVGAERGDAGEEGDGEKRPALFSWCIWERVVVQWLQENDGGWWK